jgi:hypothetical protein
VCTMIAAGCFPFTDDAGDARYSNYQEIVGNIQSAADATARKLANQENTALDCFRALRPRDATHAEEDR